MSFSLRIKRIYLPPEDTDGIRVLVDRLWPRGVAKEAAQLDEWEAAAAPSSELRRWFAHRPEAFEEFQTRYLVELDKNPAAEALIGKCREWLCHDSVTLLYAARDTTCNHAWVLQRWLEQRMASGKTNKSEVDRGKYVDSL